MILSLDVTILRRALGAVKPLTTAKAPKNGVAHGVVLAVYPSGEVVVLATNADTFARLVVGQTAARTITPTGWALDVTGVKTLLSLLPKRGPVALTVGDGGGLAVNGSAVGVSEDNGAWPMFMVGGAPPLALRAMATLDVALDIDLASAVADVCSTDETRYCLNGIFFDADGSIVATDGHRMMVLAPGMGRRAHEAAVILPQVAWRVAAKALSTMNISTTLTLRGAWMRPLPGSSSMTAFQPFGPAQSRAGTPIGAKCFRRPIPSPAGWTSLWRSWHRR